jgi:hypothetical protein
MMRGAVSDFREDLAQKDAEAAAELHKHALPGYTTGVTEVRHPAVTLAYPYQDTPRMVLPMHCMPVACC